MNLLSLQQAIITTGGPNLVVPWLGLLIAGIFMMIIGWALGRAGAPGQPLWTIIFWLGVACLIIWFILLILSLAFGIVCC